MSALVLGTVVAHAAVERPWLDASLPTEKRVDLLLAAMTQDEKIGQLVQYSSKETYTGPGTAKNVVTEIQGGACGSLLNVTGAAATRAMQQIAVEQTRLGIPLIFGFDVIHGYKTIFPIPLGQAASWDLAAIEHAERVAATEASAAGQHWTFAPMVDIARDPRWGRIAEGSGEDVFLGSAIACARVRGFQGDDLARPDTVLACAKHFAAYGAALAGRDYAGADISERTLREIYLPPFHAAVEAGAGSFMAAFNDLNGIPASANAFLLTQVLRHEWGFRGFVVSDWGSVKELVAHGYAADDREAAQRGFNAGVDMDMEGRVFKPHLAELIEAGSVAASRLDEAVRAVLGQKFRLGLFDDPYRYCNEERERAELLSPAHLEAARDVARRSMVLLKNDRALLPLAAKVRVALIGPLAEARLDQLGCWNGRGEEKQAVDIRAALEKIYPSIAELHAAGTPVTGGDGAGFAEARRIAAQADVIVAVLGESADMSGESHNRTDLDLPGRQTELLAELRATGKPVVVVLFTGRPLTLEKMLPLCDALLVAWHPGTMGGPAIADVLTGSYNPSGKLPATFPRNVGQIPLFYAHKSTGRPQPDDKERIVYRSNYLDVSNTPLFPFGFGLSYTRFEYEKLRLSAPELTADGRITVTVEVRNTGARDGTETVQLYVHDVAGSVTRPVRELKGFQKIALKQGESREVSFTLAPADLAFWRADMTFGSEPGTFEVFVGGDSDATLRAEFALKAP